MRRSRQSGIDGFILPDMIIEESYPYVENERSWALRRYFLHLPIQAILDFDPSSVGVRDLYTWFQFME